MHRTYETRFGVDPDRDPILAEYAHLYGRAERTLFARLQAGEQLTALKQKFLPQFGLTARQFNAIAAALRGKMESIRKRRASLIASLEKRIARARVVLAKIPRRTNAYHQKRRRLAILEQRLQTLQEDTASGRIRLCFGSRRLFRRQFALKALGYDSHEAWRREWQANRSNQFFVLGSKDETAGCEGCVATMESDGRVTLRLRLPNALATGGKYFVISGLRFAYGHEAIVAAIRRNSSAMPEDREAISWRFVRDHKGWRVCATVGVHTGHPISVDNIGVIGVDLNVDHLAVSETDRFGNPVASFSVPCVTRSRTRNQGYAAIGNAVSQVVTYACLRQKPMVCEQLNFDKKKDELEGRGAEYSRILSAFVYSRFYRFLSARAFDAGVTLNRVNPAYTSAIGTYKFANRYGFSRHQAAALTIGRRSMMLSERPNRSMGDHVAFPLPVRTRGKHVWSFWREVARREAAQRARGRPGPRARSSPVPTQGSRTGTAQRVIRSSAAGGIPARETSAALFG